MLPGFNGVYGNELKGRRMTEVLSHPWSTMVPCPVAGEAYSCVGSACTYRRASAVLRQIRTGVAHPTLVKPTFLPSHSGPGKRRHNESADTKDGNLSRQVSAAASRGLAPRLRGEACCRPTPRALKPQTLSSVEGGPSLSPGQ